VYYCDLKTPIKEEGALCFFSLQSTDDRTLRAGDGAVPAASPVDVVKRCIARGLTENADSDLKRAVACRRIRKQAGIELSRVVSVETRNGMRVLSRC
jgi:hypothetical protein